MGDSSCCFSVQILTLNIAYLFNLCSRLPCRTKGHPEEPQPEDASQGKDAERATGAWQHTLICEPVEIRPARTKSKPRKAKATDPARRSHTFQPKPGPQEPPLVRNITDDEIASFREQGNEVCVQTEVSGPVWVVPEYSEGADRLEMRVDHAATLAAVCSAFPGARVVEVRNTGKDTKEA
jgi:hypothetical protein